jgi:cell fate regulator YaaT (PSP1 superfamily)
MQQVNSEEYLISYGHAGEIGRFRPGEPFSCQRGDRVVVRTEHGLQIGVVLCDATSKHERLLENTFVGELLRKVQAEDEQIARGIQTRAGRLFDDARQLAAELNLPMEILDVEIQLDGHRVTLYYLRWAECDERLLVSGLSKKYEMMVALRDLALPAGASACGRPDCGNQGGGCTTCGSGGCATGCGSKAVAKDVQEYFLGLRQKMEQQNRVPLA